MEKLVEYLNEKNGQESYRVDTDSISGEKYINRGDGRQCFIDEHIISKKFGFIERLIANDKIDTKKLIDLTGEDDCVVLMRFEEDSQKVKILLLMLAISDNPVDTLISLLK